MAIDDEQADGEVSTDLVLYEVGQVSATDEEIKTLPRVLTNAQQDFLLQRTPKKEIKTRVGRGGLQFAYVEHGYVTERLNLVFGFNWDFEIVEKQILEDEVIVEARLTVRTPMGQTIVKTQFGGADIKLHASGAKSGRPISIADDYKAAASDALKKCASLLGIGLDLYGRDRPRTADEANTEADHPNLTLVQGERATPTQLKQLRALLPKVSWTEEQLAKSLGVSTLEELPKGKAARAVTRLVELSAIEQPAQPQPEAQPDQKRAEYASAINKHLAELKLNKDQRQQILTYMTNGASLADFNLTALGALSEAVQRLTPETAGVVIDKVRLGEITPPVPVT